jgi:amino acid transporter
MKSQGISRDSLPYKNMFNHNAIAAWYALILISIILFFSSYNVFLAGAWDFPTFITNYLPLFLFPITWGGYKLVKRTKWLRPAEMDFFSGLEEIEADCYEEPAPKNLWEKIWAKIV